MLTMIICNWWKVSTTSLSQQIKMLLAVLRQILLFFFGWCHEVSVLFQWWEQNNLVNVQAVLKVTCLPFKLSILGLNSFTTYYKQEEGINTWKKILGKTNVFHTSGHESMFTTRVRKTSLQTLYCRFAIRGLYSEISLWLAPGDLSLLLCQTHVNLNTEIWVTWKVWVIFVSNLF